MLTISGALSRLLGRKRYFMICVAVFTLASVGCGMSTSFTEILLFRAVQGSSVAACSLPQQAIILDYFPPEKRQQAFAITAIAIIVAPILGPIVGGYLTDTYSWNWIFLINIPFGVITLLGTARFVEDLAHCSEGAGGPPRPSTTWVSV